MSEPSTNPVPYRVAYSEQIRNELRDLLTRARSRGLGRQMLAAVTELDARLHIYPQFGDPLRDLELKPAQVWIGCVDPLVTHYSLDEERRTVFVVGTIQLLPNSGLEP
jgi:hypothetical protein